MFTINKLITKIKEGDKGRDAGSREVNSASACLPSGSAETASGNDTAEGFLCPSCMDGFSTPEDLQKHYETHHSDGAQHTCPICKKLFPTSDQLQIHYMAEHTPMGSNNVDIKAMKEELAELQTTLKEERWYSDELKREVQRLSGTVSKENTEECELYKHQIKALEESKHLLTSEVVLLRKQLGEAVETHASVKAQKESAEQKLADVLSEKDALNGAYKQESDLRSSLQNKITEMERVTLDLEAQLKERPKPEDVTALQQEVSQAQTVMNHLTYKHEAERNNLNLENMRLQKEIQSLRLRISSLEESLASAPSVHDMEHVKMELSKSESSLKALKEALQNQAENGTDDKLEQFEGLVEEKDKLLMENAFLTKNVELLKQQCQNSDLHLHDVETALKMKETEILKLVRHQEELSLEILQKSEKLSDMELKLEKEQVLFMEQLKNSENICASLEQQVEDLKVKNTHSEIVASKLHRLVGENFKTVLLKLGTLKQELVDIKRHHCSLLEVMVKEGSHVKTECINLHSVIDNLKQSLKKYQDSEKELLLKVQQLEDIRLQHETTIDDFKISLKNMNVELNQNRELVAQLQEELQLKESSALETNATLQDLKARVEDWKIKCQISETNYSQIVQNQEAATARHKEVEAKLLDLDSEYQGLLATSSRCKEELEESKLKEDHLKQTLENVKSSLEAKNKELNDNLTVATTELREAVLIKASLETELFNTHTLLTDMESKCSNFEVEVCSLKKDLVQQKDDLQKEIANLEDARELLINQKLELQRNEEALDDKLQKEKKSHEKIQETAKQTIASLQQKTIESNTNFTALQLAKDAIQHDYEQARSKYEAQLGTLKENLATLREDLRNKQEKFHTLERRMDELLGEKLELEAKLENALDERRAFSERCLRNEEECDKLRVLTVDLRKKLDDALSALHELGRENQTLQIETAKHVNRKWASDAEVDSCKSCQKAFSVTVRKHHCRHCGDIYCNECSSRTALMAAFKNPVRVCDSCFNELNNK